ncbi:MAG: hypothetical protein JW827_08965 [Spirochaetes bacterium]|nr:hypothetical protein [Spirochaetota bacterium]
MKKISFIILVFILTRFALADSPITSTDFYKAYSEIDLVKEAKSSGVMSLKIAEYLSSPSNSIDKKAAVINALSWKFEGKSNAELYSYYLALNQGQLLKNLDIDLLQADEIFCLGYLTVMDDYFHPEKAFLLLEKAKNNLKNSFTASMILALAKAQKAMDSDWCTVWKLTEEVLHNESLDQDLRPEARKIIIDYMSLYESECK